MTKKLGDLIRQTTETEGVGDIALIDPEQGYFGFVDVLGDGAQTFYVINDGLGNVEGGWGTLTAGATDSLSRDTVVFSSNSGSLVNFNSGIKTVICALPAEAIVWSPDTYAANNLPVFDGTNFKAKTASQFLSPANVSVSVSPTGTGNVTINPATAGTMNNITIGGTTPKTGTFTSITGPINGVTDGSSAASGVVGEIISSSVPSGSGVSLTSTTAANITSITLTPGDWDVWGTVYFNPAGTVTVGLGVINTVSATPAVPPNGGAIWSWTGSSTSGFGGPVGQMQINVSSTTTIYLVSRATFTSTCTTYGFIGARRRR